MSEKWIFLNGTFCLEKEATIPVTDRGFLFGDGIFTTMRVHDGKCELLNNHLQRLQKQAEALKFDWNPGGFEWICELIQRNQAGKGTWRLKIILTVKEEGMMRKTGSVLGMLHPYQSIATEPCTLSLFPHPMETPLAHIKSLSYLDHLYVYHFARQRGYSDAITQTREGFLLETGCANLFWIDQGKYWIPDPHLPYLRGVFLQALLPHIPIPIQYTKATLSQVPGSASLYICNALTHVRPVQSVNERIFSRSQEWEGRLQTATMAALKI